MEMWVVKVVEVASMVEMVVVLRRKKNRAIPGTYSLAYKTGMGMRLRYAPVIKAYKDSCIGVC